MRRLLVHASFALTFVVVACMSSRQAAAETIVGPGVVPAPFEIYGGGDYRFLPGTEIVSTQVTTFPGGDSKLGGRAIYIVDSQSYLFEGGHYEGASVAAAPPVTSVRGGSAIELYTSTNPTIVVYDGLIQGGSAIIDPSISLSNAAGGVGLDLTSRYNSRVVMFGGVVAGGVVAHASAPMTALETAFAIATGGYTDSSRHQIDIYGGELIGGVHLTGHSRFTVHGSNIDISPSPTGLFQNPTMFTITGMYDNGAPFSHSVLADPYYNGFLVRDSSSLTIEMYIVPEPSSMVLALAGVLVLRPRRRPEFGT